jgi:hypothetical protein
MYKTLSKRLQRGREAGRCFPKTIPTIDTRDWIHLETKKIKLESLHQVRLLREREHGYVVKFINKALTAYIPKKKIFGSFIHTDIFNIKIIKKYYDPRTNHLRLTGSMIEVPYQSMKKKHQNEYREYLKEKQDLTITTLKDSIRH